jgi:hypothetical protein
MVETLERRDLMAADLQPYTDGYYYPKIGKATAFLSGEISQAEWARRSDITEAARGSNSNSGSASGEASDSPFNTNEIEPNSRRQEANPLPLGTVTGKNTIVNVSGTLPVVPGSLNSLDEDYYRVELSGGDIIEAAVTGNLFFQADISVLDANGREIIGNDRSAAGNYPPTSPLRQPVNPDLTTSLAFVAPADGTYYVRVGQLDTGSIVGNYTLQLKAFRPVLESEPVGTRQIIFIDFDGGFLNRAVFGVPGTARISPLADFLPALNVQPQNESVVIDGVLASIRENLDDLGLKGNNGRYSLTGNAGDFDYTLLNSRDHEDPFGLPNVSRVFVGGTVAELQIPTIGLAQSIDVGNFDTEETGIVLLDQLTQIANAIPKAGTATTVQLFNQLVGNITTHEIGHYLGNWHTRNDNAFPQIMDTGGDILAFGNVGDDGIYGTPDDGDIDFGVDVYDPLASAISFGREDTINTTAFGLSTGTVGGTIEGVGFNDRNRNGSRDVGDEGLANMVIYADLNQNGSLEFGEPRTSTDSVGRWSFDVAAGTYQVRSQLLPGFTHTAPTSGVRTVTVGINQTVSASFGQQRPNPAVTGYKWNDLNGDGIRDQNEPGLEGVYIYVDIDGDNRIDIGEPTTISTADGSYNLTPPTSGSYAIREVVDPGFLQTFPVGGEHFVTFDGFTPLNGLDFGNRVAFDFGDAPSRYPVTIADSGARAGVIPGFRLGTRWDIDADGQPSEQADGDDLNGNVENGVTINDEDGVTFLRPIVTGDSTNRVSVSVGNTSDATAYVSAWIDFNQDGDWNDAGEKIISDNVLSAGDNSVFFAAPAAGLLGETFARFRLSSIPGVGPTGSAPGGEVEDYRVNVVDELELAVADRYTVPRNSVDQRLDVLENDFQLPGDNLRITEVTQGSRGGSVRITPAGDAVLFSPRPNFIGIETFTYTLFNSAGEASTATVSVTTQFALVDPIAIDDSFDVPTNTNGFPLNVLANDLEGQGGALRIISISTPNQGGSATLGVGGQSIRYTPAQNFGGTESFTYTAQDSSGESTTATVTVHTLAGDRLDDEVEISFVVVDESGTPISAVRQGDNYNLQVFVDDLRTSSLPGSPPILSPGVFAAYFDVLYSGSLTGPILNSDGLSFDSSVYVNPYVEGRLGTGDLPGLINDFGAFSRNQTSDIPDSILFAVIPFEARSPGVVEFAGDPAENSPLTDMLLFDSPANAVPIERIRFGRANVEIVGAGEQFPFAVDDAARGIGVNSFDTAIDVLDNDRYGTSGSVTITNATQPANGSIFIDSRGTPLDPLDDVIRYTPNTGFVGTDQFTYTIRDTNGFASTATVTAVVGANASDDDILGLRLDLTDVNGVAINQVEVGQQFQLRGYVKDLRSSSSDRGVFAAYQDILYDSTLVSTLTDDQNLLGFDIEFSNEYDEVISGDTRVPNLINEIGSIQESTSPLGSDEFLQFTITLTANAVGTANFAGDPADIKPLNDSLLFEPVDPVLPTQISYGFDSINIVAAGSGTGGGGSGSGGTGGGGNSNFTNSDNSRDVNGDGVVSPVDALLVIHLLNTDGAQDLGGNSDGGGEGEGSAPIFYDVNGDMRISPIDALLVIHYLNRGIGNGSGEGESSLSDSDLAGPADSSEEASADFVLEPVDGIGSKRVLRKVAGPVQPSSMDRYSNDELSLAAYLADQNDADDVDDLLNSLAGDVNLNWV